MITEQSHFNFSTMYEAWMSACRRVDVEGNVSMFLLIIPRKSKAALNAHISV